MKKSNLFFWCLSVLFYLGALASPMVTFGWSDGYGTGSGFMVFWMSLFSIIHSSDIASFVHSIALIVTYICILFSFKFVVFGFLSIKHKNQWVYVFSVFSLTSFIIPKINGSSYDLFHHLGFKLFGVGLICTLLSIFLTKPKKVQQLDGEECPTRF